MEVSYKGISANKLQLRATLQVRPDANSRCSLLVYLHGSATEASYMNPESIVHEKAQQ